MLRVGVTGGIGSGKTTVAARLALLGAHVVDADSAAREVVRPGTGALRLIRNRFGDSVIRDDGALDRAALAALVFHDHDALRVLEDITTPAITARVTRLREQTPAGDVSVFDMPLLVERGLWVHEHLNVVVDVEADTRVQRLVEHRGLSEADARARVAAQATDAERRAVADVLLDNTGTPAQLERSVDALWRGRIEPYAANLRDGIRTRRAGRGAVVEPRDDWGPRGQRVVAKIGAALAPSGKATEVSHIGSTAVPGLLAKDVIDVQVGVRRLTDADRPDVRAAMRDAGYILAEGNSSDTAKPGTDPAAWGKRFYGGCDPGEVVHVHVREFGSAGWRFALLFRDWLVHVSAEREAYAAEKRRLLALDEDIDAYVHAKEPWFDGAFTRANAWAERELWHPR